MARLRLFASAREAAGSPCEAAGRLREWPIDLPVAFLAATAIAADLGYVAISDLPRILPEAEPLTNAS